MPPPMSTIATPSSFSSGVRQASAAAIWVSTVSDHLEPRAVDAGHGVLRGGRRAGDDVDVHLEPGAGHARGVADPVLVVDHELLRQHVQDLAVERDRDGLGGVDHPAHVLAVDHAVLVRDRDHARAS